MPEIELVKPIGLREDGLELRSYPATVRAETKEDNKIEDSGFIHGVPIVLEEPTDIGGMFREIVRSKAISDEILKREIKLFENHNTSGLAMASSLIPLNNLGGMKLTKKDNQIEMDALLNLKRTDSNNFYLAVRDGNVKGMSFAFRVEEDEWADLDTDYPTRYINKISYISEVSGVNSPAYKQTSIGVRSVTSSENDVSVLEKARSQFINKRSGENATYKEELELLKIKISNLGGR